MRTGAEKSAVKRILLPALAIAAFVSTATAAQTVVSHGTQSSQAVVNFSDLALAAEPERQTLPKENPYLPVPQDLSVTGGTVTAVDQTPLGPAGAGAPSPGVPSPAPGKSFAALGDVNTSIPPDTHGSVGRTHIMVTLNTQVGIQSRNGAALSTVTLNSFWSSLGSPSVFDPKVLYDPYNDRWIFTACADSRSANSALLIGVSQTSDPMGSWNLFRVDADASNANWADYPSIGFSKDWVAVNVNMFSVSGNVFASTNTYVFNKAALYANTGAPHTVFSSTTLGGTHVPAITYDNALAKMYLVMNWNGNSGGNGFLRAFQIAGAVGSETFTDLGFLSTPNPWANSVANNFAPQLGSSTGIMVNDSRIQNVIYRNGSLWLTQTVFLPAASPTRSSIQWWQIDAAGSFGAVQQRSRIDDSTNTLFFAFPSIAVNRNNDVLIGYSRYAANQYASGNYSFRAGGDSPNTMRDDTVLKPGEDIYVKDFGSGRVRWGDYSHTVVDPYNDLDLWTIQEYAETDVGATANDDRWGTWWGCVGKCKDTAPLDFNQDAKSDILWRNSASGLNAVWLMNGGTMSSFAVLGGDGAWSIVRAGDFNGDGTTDIVWRNSASGLNSLSLISNGAVSSTTALGGDSTWSIIRTGDFNGDGTTDIVWRNSASGLNSLSLMQNGAIVSSTALGGDTLWSIVQTGDFNGDGTTDLVARDSTSGLNILSLISNGTVASSTILGGDSTWSIVQTGDFNGDGTTDLVWRNSASGANSLSLLQNGAISSSAALGGDTNWSIARTGDFNGDGTTDIVWRNSASGLNSLSVVKNGAILSSAVLGGDTNWAVAFTGDYNGDGTSDIGWRNSITGLNVMWLMSNGAVASSSILGGDSNWSVVVVP